ncbi:hypothetical protein [Streptosporangium sp. NPDC020145]|uniref:hypothetical protein n=1 Tax=Streptosporangium sp. NPDC020145 TaxID=3154694 RepID=UPI00342B8638
MNKLGRAAASNWPAIACTVGPSSAVAGLAMHAAGQYGDVVALGALGTAGTAGALALASLSKKWSETFSWASGAFSLATLHAGVSALSGWGWPTLYSWVISSGLSFAAYLAYRHHTRHDTHHLDKQIKMTKYQTGLVRLETAQMALAGKLTASTTAIPEPAPVLTGTVLERAIAEALRTRWKTLPLAVRVADTPYGWAASVELPATLTRVQVVKNWDSVSSHLAAERHIRTDKFEVRNGDLPNRVVVHHFDRDLLSDVLPYEPAGPGRTFLDPILLGIDQYGQAAEFETAYRHTIIAGSSDFGKSNLVKLVAFRLAEAGAELYGIDMKSGAPELRQIEPLLSGLATNLEQGRALFEGMLREMDERGEILVEHGDTKWVPEKHGRKPIFVLADELAELVREGDDKGNPLNEGEGKISSPLMSLLARARAFGIHFVLITQTPSKVVFGGTTDGRNNVANRICVRMNEKHLGTMVFGADSGYDPKSLHMPGEFLMQTPTLNSPVHYKAQFISDETCRMEVTRLAEQMAVGSKPRIMVLPPPTGVETNQDKVLHALGKYGRMPRKDIDEATGLTTDQVRRALREIKHLVECHGGADGAPPTYSLRPGGRAALRVVREG